MEAMFLPMQVRPASELPFHTDAGPGERFLALDSSLCNASAVYIAVRQADDVPQGQEDYVEPHCHSADSVFLFLGRGAGMEGLEAIVRLADREHHVKSPMTVFIPQGTVHSYKLTAGSGTFLNIVLSGDYADTTHP